MLKRILWNNKNEPVMTSIDAIMDGVRDDDIQDGLLYDAPTMSDILSGADMDFLDGIVVNFVKLRAKMLAMKRIMNTQANDEQQVVGDPIISDPFMRLGTAQVAVLFQLKDGQAITIYFHNPDSDPKKIKPNDPLVSFKFLLNKKDVTIVVAAEKGREINVREVAMRVMKLANKNSAAFLRQNKKAAERKAMIEELTKTVETKKGILVKKLKEIEVLEAVQEQAKIDSELKAKEQVKANEEFMIKTKTLFQNILEIAKDKGFNTYALDDDSLAIVPTKNDVKSFLSVTVKTNSIGSYYYQILNGIDIENEIIENVETSEKALSLAKNIIQEQYEELRKEQENPEYQNNLNSAAQFMADKFIDLTLDKLKKSNATNLTLDKTISTNLNGSNSTFITIKGDSTVNDFTIKAEINHSEQDIVVSTRKNKGEGYQISSAYSAPYEAFQGYVLPFVDSIFPKNNDIGGVMETSTSNKYNKLSFQEGRTVYIDRKDAESILKEKIKDTIKGTKGEKATGKYVASYAEKEGSQEYNLLAKPRMNNNELDGYTLVIVNPKALDKKPLAVMELGLEMNDLMYKIENKITDISGLNISNEKYNKAFDEEAIKTLNEIKSYAIKNGFTLPEQTNSTLNEINVSTEELGINGFLTLVVNNFGAESPRMERYYDVNNWTDTINPVFQTTQSHEDAKKMAFDVIDRKKMIDEQKARNDELNLFTKTYQKEMMAELKNQKERGEEPNVYKAMKTIQQLLNIEKNTTSEQEKQPDQMTNKTEGKSKAEIFDIASQEVFKEVKSFAISKGFEVEEIENRYFNPMMNNTIIVKLNTPVIQKTILSINVDNQGQSDSDKRGYIVWDEMDGREDTKTVSHKRAKELAIDLMLQGLKLQKKKEKEKLIEENLISSKGYTKEQLNTPYMTNIELEELYELMKKGLNWDELISRIKPIVQQANLQLSEYESKGTKKLAILPLDSSDNSKAKFEIRNNADRDDFTWRDLPSFIINAQPVDNEKRLMYIAQTVDDAVNKVKEIIEIAKNEGVNSMRNNSLNKILNNISFENLYKGTFNLYPVDDTDELLEIGKYKNVTSYNQRKLLNELKQKYVEEQTDQMTNKALDTDQLNPQLIQVKANPDVVNGLSDLAVEYINALSDKLKKLEYATSNNNVMEITNVDNEKDKGALVKLNLQPLTKTDKKLILNTVIQDETIKIIKNESLTVGEFDSVPQAMEKMDELLSDGFSFDVNNAAEPQAVGDEFSEWVIDNSDKLIKEVKETEKFEDYSDEVKKLLKLEFLARDKGGFYAFLSNFTLDPKNFMAEGTLQKVYNALKGSRKFETMARKQSEVIERFGLDLNQITSKEFSEYKKQFKAEKEEKETLNQVESNQSETENKHKESLQFLNDVISNNVDVTQDETLERLEKTVSELMEDPNYETEYKALVDEAVEAYAKLTDEYSKETDNA